MSRSMVPQWPYSWQEPHPPTPPSKAILSLMENHLCGPGESNLMLHQLAIEEAVFPGQTLIGEGLAISPSATQPMDTLSFFTWLNSRRAYSREICSLPSGLQSAEILLASIPAFLSNQYK